MKKYIFFFYQIKSIFYQELQEAEKILNKEEIEKKKKENKPLVAPPAPNPILLGLTPNKYLLKVIYFLLHL